MKIIQSAGGLEKGDLLLAARLQRQKPLSIALGISEARLVRDPAIKGTGRPVDRSGAVLITRDSCEDVSDRVP